MARQIGRLSALAVSKSKEKGCTPTAAACDGHWEYLVMPETWRTEICKGFDARQLTKELIARRMIIPGADGRPTTLMRVPGYKQPIRLYRLSSAILAGEGGNIG